MGTRGRLIIDGEHYYRRFDAYPSSVLEEAQTCFMGKTSKKEFVKCMDLVKMSEKDKKDFTYPFEEYRYDVDLYNKEIEQVEVPSKKGWKPSPEVKELSRRIKVGKGWRNEPLRHSLARKGVKTGRKRRK